MARRKAEPLKNAHVHRFRQRVAISLPGRGETVYLTADEANWMADQLAAGAKDVVDCPSYADSSFSTRELELSDPFKQTWGG